VAATKYTSSTKLNFQLTHAKNDLPVKSEEKYFVVWYKKHHQQRFNETKFSYICCRFSEYDQFEASESGHNLMSTHSTCIENNCSIL